MTILKHEFPVSVCLNDISKSIAKIMDDYIKTLGSLDHFVNCNNSVNDNLIKDGHTLYDEVIKLCQYISDLSYTIAKIEKEYEEKEKEILDRAKALGIEENF